LLAWDTEGTDHLTKPPVGTVYILASIRMKGAIILQHVDAMRRIAANVPVAWPHDGHVRDRGSGEALAAQYRKAGLIMLNTHATHATGGYSTEAGIMDMDGYMQARQFKVLDNQPDWFQEYGQYHRKDGLIVKVHDDLMSATRIAHMMRRYARAVPLGSRVGGAKPTIREIPGKDFDLFA
jgi:hypothetical protein